MLWHRELRDPTKRPEDEWHATLRRIRGEFDEMPGTRLTFSQALAFFGLPNDAAARALFDRLAEEGFLDRSEDGVYKRRTETP